jgi:hypothetical protein
MSNMSELWIRIEELLADGMTPQAISTRLNIPVEWVDDVASELQDECAYAESAADADAAHYGEF